MTKRHKSFGSPSAEAEALEDMTFELEGETFTCYPAIPGATLLEFVELVDSGDESGTPKALLMLINKAIIKDDLDDFNKLIHDPNIAIPVETIGEIATWMVETYTKRPTKRVSSLAGGRARTGRSSTEDVSSPESTQED